MTNTRSMRRQRAPKEVEVNAAGTAASPQSESASIQVERSGDWMPADQLQQVVLAALTEGRDLTLDLERIDHLDASALQILLAAGTEMEKCGKNFRLVKASAHLRKWFEFAGADQCIFDDKADEQ